MRARLGVNIDHVATIRQQRGEMYPSLKQAAIDVLKAGADQITIHLREDQRHIQSYDVPVIHEVCKNFNRPLNLEMACSPFVVEIACKQKPEWICIVPEKREERTTEGGLDLKSKDAFLKLQETIKKLRTETPQSKISLFIEADEEALHKAAELSIDAVEIHTGDYAKKCLQKENLESFFKKYQRSFEICQKNKISYHAGHGLTPESLEPLLKLKIFSEYNIGHWIIAESLFKGLSLVVRELKQKLEDL